jgi:elongation factor G
VEEAQFIRQMDGRGHYARCVLRIEPLPTGKGFEFNDDVRGRIPSEYVPAVVEGVREALSEGVLAGYPIVDVKVDLIDGSYHDIDSNVAAFRTAGAMALRSGCEKAEPIILEPIMECEVLVPDQYADAAVGDLNSRRARIFAVGDRAELKSIKCSVPLSEMFGYPDLLRSLTNGRGSFSMRASHFEEIPRDHYKAIIDPHTGDDPPAAPAGRPVRPIRPRPGLSGGGSRPIPPDSD